MKNENIKTLFFCKTGDFLTVFIPKNQNGSQNTASTYKCGLKAFRSYVNDVKGIPTNKFRFEDCTYDFLLDYRNYLHDEKKLTEKTANNRLATIKSYVNYASASDVTLQQYAFAISRVPFYSVPKTQRPIIEDVDALTAMLSMPPNTKKGLRDKVIMSVLYDGGIRLDELIGLKIRDLNLSDECIRVKIRGKGNKERTDILDSKTSALIRQYLSEYHPEMNLNSPFIYTVIKGSRGAMSSRNVQKLIKKYADKVRENYSLPESVSPHTFRRTRGTMLYRETGDIYLVADVLGHKDVNTTRKHYAAMSEDRRRMAAEIIKLRSDEKQPSSPPSPNNNEE